MYCKAYKRQSDFYNAVSYYKNIPDNSDWKGIVKDYFASSMLNSIAHTSAVMIPKPILSEFHGFNVDYNSGEDTDLWIRVALRYPVAFYNKVSSIYKIDVDYSISSSSLSKRKHLDLSAFNTEESQNVSLKNYLDLNRLSLAFQYKIAGDSKTAKQYLNAIKPGFITWYQKIALKLPVFALKHGLSFRNFLRRFRLDLRLFR